MFDHMEIPLHDYYGSLDFWLARRSMRYNNELYKVANEFRKKYLNSTDENDKTIRPPDWKDEKVNIYYYLLFFFSYKIYTYIFFFYLEQKKCCRRSLLGNSSS